MEEVLNQLITFLTELGGGWAVGVAFVTALCAAVAIVLPTPGENSSKLWRFVYRLINVLGANVGKARNFDDVVDKLGKEAARDAEQSAPDKLG